MTKTLLLTVVVATLLLTGCAGSAVSLSPPPSAKPTVAPSPSATPKPAKPDLADLIVTPEGIGPVRIGLAPPVTDPEVDIVIFDPDVCQWAVDEGDRAEPGMWIPNDPRADQYDSGPFGVWVEGGVVTHLEMHDPEVRTSEGIGMFSPVGDVMAAYPGIEKLPGDGYSDSDNYIIRGNDGDLHFAIVKATSAVDYPELGEVVVRMSVLPHGAWPPSFNSDAGIGRCVGA